MSVFLQPIYTQTVGSGGASSITFNNIPQTFTDLKVVVSGRTNVSATLDYFLVQPNGATTNLSGTRIQGNGSAASSARYTALYVPVDGATATANSFGNVEVYIPNYTSSNFKSMICDAVAESNTSAMYQELWAFLWSSTSAITSLTIGNGGQNFVQYSTFSLYGVLRNGI